MARNTFCLGWNFKKIVKEKNFQKYYYWRNGPEIDPLVNPLVPT